MTPDEILEREERRTRRWNRAYLLWLLLVAALAAAVPFAIRSCGQYEAWTRW